ncbi:MAG: hypothetical protein HY862_19810 [Chloroflexi bacterium]|nr:hypothetical protein [Chloroflexota bacterium]
MKRSLRLCVVLCVVLLTVSLVGGTNSKPAEAATVSFHGTLSYGIVGTDNAFDIFSLVMTAGQTIEIIMLCDDAQFDPFVRLYDPAGVFIASNDDGYPGGPEDPCDYSSDLTFTAPADGNYIVHATTYDANYGYFDRGYGSGGYTIIGSGSFVAFGPTANNVPNLGLVKLDTGQTQPAYVSAGGGQVLQGSDGASVFLPADADHSGYDTYVVTDAVEVDGAIWIAVWLGGVDYGWLPLSGVTPITQLAIE